MTFLEPLGKGSDCQPRKILASLSLLSRTFCNVHAFYTESSDISIAVSVALFLDSAIKRATQQHSTNLLILVLLSGEGNMGKTSGFSCFEAVLSLNHISAPYFIPKHPC